MTLPSLAATEILLGSGSSNPAKRSVQLFYSGWNDETYLITRNPLIIPYDARSSGAPPVHQDREPGWLGELHLIPNAEWARQKECNSSLSNKGNCCHHSHYSGLCITAYDLRHKEATHRLLQLLVDVDRLCQRGKSVDRYLVDNTRVCGSAELCCLPVSGPLCLCSVKVL